MIITPQPDSEPIRELQWLKRLAAVDVGLEQVMSRSVMARSPADVGRQWRMGRETATGFRPPGPNRDWIHAIIWQTKNLRCSRTHLYRSSERFTLYLPFCLFELHAPYIIVHETNRSERVVGATGHQENVLPILGDFIRPMRFGRSPKCSTRFWAILGDSTEPPFTEALLLNGSLSGSAPDNIFSVRSASRAPPRTPPPLLPAFGRQCGSRVLCTVGALVLM